MSILFRRHSREATPPASPSLNPLFQHHHDSTGSTTRLSDLGSQYSSLLDPVLTTHAASVPAHLHRRAKSYTAPYWAHVYSAAAVTNSDLSTRPWLMVAEAGAAGDRPPMRKLVKEPNRSSRPSFSLELSDGETERKYKGGVWRRHLTRLKELYRRTEK